MRVQARGTDFRRVVALYARALLPGPEGPPRPRASHLRTGANVQLWDKYTWAPKD